MSLSELSIPPKAILSTLFALNLPFFFGLSFTISSFWGCLFPKSSWAVWGHCDLLQYDVRHHRLDCVKMYKLEATICADGFISIAFVMFVLMLQNGFPITLTNLGPE